MRVPRLRLFCATWVCLAGIGSNFLSAQADEPKVKEPVANRVYQRDENGRATIPIVLEGVAADKIDNVMIQGMGGQPIAAVPYANGALVGVPTGGPYAIVISYRNESGEAHGQTIAPVFVGDVWILAGQSNMEGVGDLVDVTQPNDRVMSLGMDGKWVRAEEPLHWLVDSPDPVHSGNPDDRAARSEAQHKSRRKGAGLGLPFATAMVQATGVPVGLVCCAHGGTSMAQWDPAKKDEGGKSLYGSMIRQTNLAGGKFKGLLWYQGESDANEQAAKVYPQVFADFIAAVRKDLNQPDLPFYLVQIGRFVNPGNPDPKYWNAVQDAERLIPERVSNTAVIAVIDLELDDLIHVGTQGMKRAGRRMANVALHELFGRPNGTTPTLDRVSRGPNNTLVVKFKGVNGNGLQPARHIGGFSIRKADSSDLIPILYEAAVGKARDTVVLKLVGPPPSGATLWYGWGMDPYCNLTDSLDMAVPVFGPIALDDVK